MTLEIVTRAGKRPYPPRVTAFTAPFWAGLAAGRFLLGYCAGCGHRSFPPKSICPICWGREIGWSEHAGDGVLYSHTEMHAAPTYFLNDIPYRVCIVDLADGPRVATRLIGAHGGTPLGSAVQLVVLAYEDGHLFAAQPAERQ